MALARGSTAILGAACLVWALGGQVQAAPVPPPVNAPAHKALIHKAPARRVPAHKTGGGKSKPAPKRAHPATAVRGKLSGHHDAKPKSAVLALARCYGQFIAWRDELSGLMLQANSFTPWPDDHIRFDRVERAFAAGARRDRGLALTLEPTFRESDFPPDIRTAFRAGLKQASAAFAASGYKQTQIVVIGQPDISPRQRMAQLEANADEAFAPLAAPCERLIGARPAGPRP